MKKVVGHIKAKGSKLKSTVKSMTLGSAVLVGGISVGLVLMASSTLSQLNLTPVQKMARQEQKTKDVVKNLMTGCISRALEDVNLAGPVFLSGGQVCFQVLGKTVETEMQGKGYCALNDSKCQFKIGYVKTAIVVSESELSDNEIQDLETSAEAAYESAL